MIHTNCRGVYVTRLFIQARRSTARPCLNGVLCGFLRRQLAPQIVLGTSVTLNSNSGTRFTYVDGIHVRVSNDPVLPLHVFAMDRQCEVLGHNPILVDDLHASLLEGRAEILQGNVVVELSPVDETTGPREDGGHWVR